MDKYIKNLTKIDYNTNDKYHTPTPWVTVDEPSRAKKYCTCGGSLWYSTEIILKNSLLIFLCCHNCHNEVIINEKGSLWRRSL